MEIKGTRPPRLKIMEIVADGTALRCVAEYDGVNQALRHKYPVGGEFFVYVDDTPMTILEFDAWLQAQKN